MQVQVNGITSYSNVNFDKTLYASPYLVMDEHEYTKHYYIEGERVCSKIGGGFGPADVLPTSTPLNFIAGDEDELANVLKHLVYNHVECTGYSGNWEISHTLQPAYNTEHNFENKQYFYHPDHLGSSSFITNALGRAEQHLQYLPFGELWINQRNSEFDSPYKFSGKELDSESGYNYFGARYYDSEASIWLSVDPMAKERPSLSPYNYVQWNALNRVDPTGMLDDDYFTKDGKYLGSDGDENSHNIRIVDEETYNNLLGENDSEGKPLLQTSGDAVLWNDSEMSSEARLAVYEHYNETGLRTEINNEKVKRGVIMSYSTHVKIKIPVEQNVDEVIVNNYYNIKNSFDHEKGHYLDHVKFGSYYFDMPTSTKEVRAIWYQMSQPNFKHVSTKYYKGIYKYLNDNFNNFINGK